MRQIHRYLHHLLVPKESNNYRSKALHLDFLTVYLLIALVFSIGVKQLKQGDVLGFATDITVENLLKDTNQERANNSLPPLSYNEKLAVAANEKAHNMFEHNYWAHFAPDGTTPWSFILASGYQYSVAGENLAKGFYFSDSVVKAWMDSPSHKANLLRDSYQDVGFAVVNGTLDGQPTTLVVQMFGTPLSPQVAAQQQIIPTKAIEPTSKLAEKPYYQPEGAVLAKNSTSTTPKFNLFPLFFNINIVFLIFLVIVLFVDFYLTKKMNVLKIGGKNLAHIIFIGFIFLGIWIISNGGNIN